MSSSKILSVAIEAPQYSSSTEEIIPYVKKWLNGNSDRYIKKAIKIFEMSNIQTRHSIMPIHEVFTPTSFEDKNDLFIREMKILTSKALIRALKKANISPGELDAIITVSCTSFMIPSMDAYLINELQLRQDILRLPVTEMGCAGGTSSLIYAEQYLKANPGNKLAIVSFESPTATFQHNDDSMTNIISASLFGDGVAAVILGESKELLPQIIDSTMFHIYDEEDLMGFKLTNSGLKMVLDPEVPNKIESNFDLFLLPFLNRNDLKLENLDHLLFHPGGKKIIQLIEGRFRQFGKSLGTTKKVLHDYGNMSSSTILYVLNAFLKKEIKPEENGLMLSFGPGFSAQLVLLRWNF